MRTTTTTQVLNNADFRATAVTKPTENISILNETTKQRNNKTQKGVFIHYKLNGLK